MATVDFVDTSILVNLLDVPHMNRERAEVIAEMRRKRAAGVQFIMPITTGTHSAPRHHR